MSVYFCFCNENSWFKISKDDKNYLQSCEFCLMVGNRILCWAGRIDNHKISRVVRDDNLEWKWWPDGMDGMMY